jgi:2-isopropylmalate synthase
VGDNQLNDAFKRFKDLADRKKVVYDEDIAALVDDEVGRSHGRISLAGLNVSTGMGSKPMATVSLDVDGERRDGMAIGDGAVDATFNAIRQAWPHEISLKLYAVQSITGGTDAQARVTVRFEEGGKLVDGQGATPAPWWPRRAPMCTRSTSCWSSASGPSRPRWPASRRREAGQFLPSFRGSRRS